MGEGEAAHHHRDYRPRVTIIIVSIVFVARSTALVLIAFDVLLDFCPDSSFFLVFYLFLFSFSLFSALFVLLVVYAAPSGGVCVCGAAGVGSSSFALWAWPQNMLQFGQLGVG